MALRAIPSNQSEQTALNCWRPYSVHPSSIEADIAQDMIAQFLAERLDDFDSDDRPLGIICGAADRSDDLNPE